MAIWGSDEITGVPKDLSPVLACRKVVELQMSRRDFQELSLGSSSEISGATEAEGSIEDAAKI